MENGRRKVWICLTAVLAAAVVVGLIYLWQKESSSVKSGEGILIRQEVSDCYAG